jgi:nicotinic acid mononucleotide adenylyltransferase
MSKPPIVFSFQGAFGPPTLGHYTAMKLYARKVLEDYPEDTIHMLFMPTALGSSKPHLEPTQESRIKLLNKFCEYLSGDHEFAGKPISFSPSTIEYELCREPKEDGTPNKDTGTYRTLIRLRKMYPESTLLLGMGLDNMLQMPYWKQIEDYKSTLGVEKIYVASRQLTEEEATKTRRFHKEEGSPVVNFDIVIPNWGQPTVEQANRVFNINIENPTYETLEKKMATNMPSHEAVYTCNIDFPDFVMVGEEGERIPGTSSSMMRYYICKLIQEPSEEYREKIRKLIWGDKPIDDLVTETIEDYRQKIYSEGIPCPPDKDYDESFLEIFPTAGGKKRTCKRRRRKSANRRRRTCKRRRNRNKHSKKN